jgi:hypothetical protein
MCDVEVLEWCGMGDGVIAFGSRIVASRYTYGIRIPIGGKLTPRRKDINVIVMNIKFNFKLSIKNLSCLDHVCFEDEINKSQAIVPFVAAHREHASVVILLYQYT